MNDAVLPLVQLQARKLNVRLEIKLEERLAPILMTVLAAGLSLLPLVISGKLPGQEIEYPMAWVILLGLASATLVNLFILPVGCAIFLKQIPASELEREALAPCSVPGENV